MGSSVEIKNNSIVKAFLLTVQPARAGKIFLGSKQTGTYLLVDERWKNLAEIFKNSEDTVEEISKKLIKADPVSFHPEKTLTQLKIMLMQMSQNKLISRIDKEVLYERKRQTSSYFDRLVRKISDYIGSPFFVLADLFLTVLFLFVMLFFTDLFPRSGDFFWSNYLSLTVFTAFAFAWISTLIHEAAHLLIGRAFGIRGTLTLSNMLNFLVVEAKFPDIYSIKKSGRIAIYLSGMVIDMVAILAFYFLILSNRSHPVFSNIVIRIIKQFILIEWLSILWEFFFYMKTDIYLVIKELLGIENLYTYSKQKIISKLTFKKIDLPLNKREGRILNLYVVFLIIGTLVGLSRYFFYHVPIIINIVLNSFNEISNGIYTKNLVLLLDGLVVISIEFILTSLLLISILRKRRS